MLLCKALIALIAALAPGIVGKVGILYSKAARLKYASSWRAWDPIGVLITNWTRPERIRSSIFGLPSWTLSTSSTWIPKLSRYNAVPLVAINLNPKINTYSLQEIHNY